MSAALHDEVIGPCRNCGVALPVQDPSPRYCTQCGQETALHPPTLGEFIHEFVGHYVALEGALWKTLGLLLFRPGRLTLEYFAGRRRRYVLPLRIYLTASFLFFLCVKLVPGDGPPPGVQTPPNPVAALKQGLVVRDDGDQGLDDCLKPGAQCGAIETRFARAVQRWEHDPQALRHFKNSFVGTLPYAVFLMLPVFAALVMLAYRGRRMRYGEHVVFSFHMHSFWFLSLLAGWLLPTSASDLLLFAVPVYGVWALRTVYGGRWWPTLLRAGVITGSYLLLLALATGLLVGALFMAA